MTHHMIDSVGIIGSGRVAQALAGQSAGVYRDQRTPCRPGDHDTRGSELPNEFARQRQSALR
jgi:hypothetical protein